MDDKLDRAAELIKLLAHPMRMRIVLTLQQHPSLNVTELIRLLQAEQSLLSHNLISMKDRGILNVTRQGKERYYSLADPVYAELVQLLLESSFLEMA